MTDEINAEAPLRLDLPTIYLLGEQLMPDYRTMSAVEARAVFAAIPPTPGPDVASAEDIEIGDGMTGRLYAPPGGVADGERPLVVYFHGGGFTIGDVAGYDGTTRRLCALLGAPLLSVDYRLAPEHPFPTAADDAWAAFTWASESPHAANGLALAGDSAGANLAAVTARRAAAMGIDVRHQLLFYPCLDPAQSLESHRRVENDSPFLSSEDMAWYWRQYLDGTDVVRDENGGTSEERIDPRHAPVPDGLAPATIVLAGRDPLHDEGAQYASVLSSAGMTVTSFDYPDLFHGFIGFAGVNDEAEAALNEVVQSVSAALASPAEA